MSCSALPALAAAGFRQNIVFLKIRKKAVSLVPGTAITIPANVKHWHGAKPYSWFSHIAVKVPDDNASSEWLEEWI